LGDDVPYLPLRIAILVIAFCLSAFFSGSETALFSLPKDELDDMKDRPGPDRVIALLREQPKRLLVTILFGNMFVNVVFYSVSFAMVLSLAGRLSNTAQMLFGLGSLLAIVLGGEVVPKNLAFTFYRPCARAVARPMFVIQRLLAPVVVPLGRIADLAVALIGGGAGPRVRAEELQTLVYMGAREGVIDAGAEAMITEVIGLSDVRISELMVPRVEVVSFHLNRPESELLRLFRRSKLTMIPVYEAVRDNMQGLIHVKDLLLKDEGQPLAALVRPAPFLPETATIEEALRECQRHGSQTAFVVDEYGALVGLITVEDLLEEIVGEIADEYDADEPPLAQPLGHGRYRLRGAMGLREWLQLSGMAEPAGLEVDTVGGFVMALLDRMPQVGDGVSWGGMQFVVESVDGRRVETILAAPLRSEGEGGR
jgi:CBS domain containing-hemolysin-like protein